MHTLKTHWSNTWSFARFALKKKGWTFGRRMNMRFQRITYKQVQKVKLSL
jgi:hypothetical protein